MNLAFDKLYYSGRMISRPFIRYKATVFGFNEDLPFRGSVSTHTWTRKGAEAWIAGKRDLMMAEPIDVLETFYVWPNGDVWPAEEWDALEDCEKDKSDDFETVIALDEHLAWEGSVTNAGTPK